MCPVWTEEATFYMTEVTGCTWGTDKDHRTSHLFDLTFQNLVPWSLGFSEGCLLRVREPGASRAPGTISYSDCFGTYCLLQLMQIIVGNSFGPPSSATQCSQKAAMVTTGQKIWGLWTSYCDWEKRNCRQKLASWIVKIGSPHPEVKRSMTC